LFCLFLAESGNFTLPLTNPATLSR
jgi:hypothetical protein